jgi:A-factor biosynthesis hotdog domain
MSDTLWHVVGNCFTEFARNKNVSLISELIGVFRRGCDFPFGDDVRFIAGQGLQETLVDELLEEAEKAGRMHLFARWRGIERAQGPLSHKRRTENTMITTPLRAGEDAFEAELCLDERVDLITDHVTGQHLPGMILVEAGRQMFIATFERHFNQEQQRVSFLVTGMNNTFHHFAFPVGTQIRTKILEKKLDDPGKLFFHELTEAFQAGRCIFAQEGRITVCREKITSLLEVRSAKQVLRSIQAELDAPARIAS